MIPAVITAPLLGLVKEALSAAAGYFWLKKERLLYDLIEISEKRQMAMTTAIETCRQQKTEAATQRADLIFQNLQKEKAKYEKLLNSL